MKGVVVVTLATIVGGLLACGIAWVESYAIERDREAMVRIARMMAEERAENPPPGAPAKGVQR